MTESPARTSTSVTEEEYRDAAGTHPHTRVNSHGERETYDYASGLWFTDRVLVEQVKGRRARRQILGSREDTLNLNRDGL